MRTLKKITAIIMLLISIATLTQCKKKDVNGLNVQPVYLDIPFEITTKDSFYLTDGTTNIGLRLISIYDDRATGFLCSISTGGQANIAIGISLNNVFLDTCLKSIPGCSNGAEYDTLNPTAPKCLFQPYRIYLLKLNPYDKKEDDISKYSVKYVIKK